MKGRLLFALNDMEGLISKDLSFFKVQLDNGKLQKMTSLPVSWIQKKLSKFRFTNRLLRLDVRCVERLTDARFVLSAIHKMWLLDIDSKRLSELMPSREGFSDTLNICFDGKCIYWGDYGPNDDNANVNIYRLNQDEKIDIIYSFPEGSVRHIHNIVYDRENRRFWMMTGDNEKQSGIYIADLDWSNVSPVKTGEQRYRAVAAFPYGNGIVYATDSVESDNYIYFLSFDGHEKILASLNGSCIYSGENRSHFFFSTTVESPEGRGIKALLSCKLGGGIKNRNVELVAVDKRNLETRVVRRFEKDIWPMKLLQYGTAMFPKGQELRDDLWIYLVACKHFDGKILNIKGI